MKTYLPKRSRQAWILPLGFVLVAVMGVSAAYIAIKSQRESMDLAVAKYQSERAEIVASRVRTFLLTATQIAKSQRAFVEHYDGHDKKQIETYLEYFLESTSEDLIYGTGVWYEPGKFNGKDHYFGPYVHRGDRAGTRVLTYEWNTPDYDYPSHPWYRLGLKAGRKPVFSEPYLDRGLVYMSLMLGFSDRETGAFKGIISVGMIMPQLQSIIESVNKSSDDTIYLIGRSNQIIAHPRGREIIEVAQKAGAHEHDIRSILDTSLEDGLQPVEAPVIHQELIEESGWHVVVVSPFASVYKSFLQFRSLVMNGVAIFLLALVAIYRLIVYFRHRMDKIAQKSFEDLRSAHEELLSIADHVQVAILRCDKQGQIEKGFTPSSYRILGRVEGESLSLFKLWDLLGLEGGDRSAFIAAFHKIFAEPYLAEEHLGHLNRQIKIKSKVVDLRFFPIKKYGQIEFLLVLIDPVPPS